MQKRHKYTEEEVEFLVLNSPKYSRKDLTSLFNKKFRRNISIKAITNKCNSFQAFGREERHCVGDEVLRSDGYVIVKTTNDKSIPKHKRWELKHRIVWQKEFGEIPKGYVLIFKDGDRSNCDISNLVLVKREVVTIMSRNSMFSKSAELNEQSIAISKAILKLAEKERELNQFVS